MKFERMFSVLRHTNRHRQTDRQTDRHAQHNTTMVAKIYKYNRFMKINKKT